MKIIINLKHFFWGGEFFDDSEKNSNQGWPWGKTSETSGINYLQKVGDEDVIFRSTQISVN